MDNHKEVDNHKEQLMSMDFRCPCSGRFAKMKAVEYRSGTWLRPEEAIYECTLCGKRLIAVHSPDVAPAQAVQPLT